ncbi:LpqB family beta-propeller domain-containing protein [Actinomycetes bacterium KLBMP 9797]
MTRRWTALVAVAVVGLALAGCGIPGETDVRVDGSGPPGLATGANADIGAVPPKRDAATTREEFVDNYLKAAAGDPGEAYGRVGDYLAPSARRELKDQQDAAELNLVRVVSRTVADQPDGTAVATVRVRQIGVLLPDGQVNAPKQTAAEYRISITAMEKERGWFVATAPKDGLLLSDDGLADYYESQTLYFWNLERTGLVPDPRYMAKAVSRGSQPTEIVRRLLTPPSGLIAPVVRIPEGVKLIGNVPDTGTRLEIRLSAEAAAEGYDPLDLGRQILWSLPSGQRKPLTLKIEGQPDLPVEMDDAYRVANPTSRLAETPERFAIYKGKVHRLDSSPNLGRDPLPSLFSAQVNHDLAAVALASEPGVTAAALVMGASGSQRLLVGATGDDPTIGPTQVDGKQYPAIGRPAWLKAPLDTGLVAIGGTLHRFGLHGGGLTPVPLPPGVGPVTAVSAAPDGRRIALVAGGGLYVAAVSRADGAVDVQQTQAVRTSLGQVTDVAWNPERQLVVAGVLGNKSAILTIRVDGTAESDAGLDPEASVTYVVAYPNNPLTAEEQPEVMYVAGGAGYDYEGDNNLIVAEEVVAGPANAQPGEAGAPFFLN